MKRSTKILILILVIFSAYLFLSLLSAYPVSAENSTFPSIISLPNGFQPESIDISPGGQFYVGSIPTGAIYSGDLRTGQGSIFIPAQTGRRALGLGLDQRTNLLYVAGGPTGNGYVYDANNGSSMGEYTFSGGFVNDVAIAQNAVYFTDSYRPVLYRISLGSAGSDPSGMTTIPLGGDFNFVQGSFNANGIDVTPNGKFLIIVNSALGTLYRVDPETGNARLINLGGASVPNGDGILLEGQTLFVVQNQMNKIAAIQLDRDLTSGILVGYITDSRFQVPTALARFAGGLYIVNARFDVTPAPTTEYNVVRTEVPEGSMGSLGIEGPELNESQKMASVWGGIKASN
jgi:hypothetical protein